MNTQTEQLERKRLLELAQEYRKKGYQVILSPNTEEIPDFIQNCDYHPDMIAHGEKESVVVEVKSRRSMMTSAQNLQNLAKVIEEHPSWRLELVLTNPEGALYFSKIEGSLAADEIKSKLSVARELIHNHLEPAILYAYSLAEATLRLVANHEGLIFKKLESPLNLLNQLATEGIISQTEYRLLMDVFQLRNAIAYGFKTTPLTAISILEMMEITEQLLDSLNTTKA